jgi:hypothetical protein
MPTNTSTVETTTTTRSDSTPKSGELCVVDLGKFSKKQIRKLRRGEGKLMTKAERVVQDLKANGVLAKDATTVVLVVRQKVVDGGPLGGLLLD